MSLTPQDLFSKAIDDLQGGLSISDADMATVCQKIIQQRQVYREINAFVPIPTSPSLQDLLTIALYLTDGISIPLIQAYALSRKALEVVDHDSFVRALYLIWKAVHAQFSTADPIILNSFSTSGSSITLSSVLASSGSLSTSGSSSITNSGLDYFSDPTMQFLSTLPF